MLVSSGSWPSFIRQSPEHSVYCHASWNVSLAVVKIPILQWGSRFFEVHNIQKNLRKGIQAITLSPAVCFDLGSHLGRPGQTGCKLLCTDNNYHVSATAPCPGDHLLPVDLM